MQINVTFDNLAEVREFARAFLPGAQPEVASNTGSVGAVPKDAPAAADAGTGAGVVSSAGNAAETPAAATVTEPKRRGRPPKVTQEPADPSGKEQIKSLLEGTLPTTGEPLNPTPEPAAPAVDAATPARADVDAPAAEGPADQEPAAEPAKVYSPEELRELAGKVNRDVRLREVPKLLAKYGATAISAVPAANSAEFADALINLAKEAA